MRLVFIIFFFLTSCFLKAQTLTEAQYFLDRSEYSKAIPLFESIKKTGIKNNDTDKIILANNGIADSYTDIGAYYKSITLLKENILLLNKAKSKNYELSANTHILLANNYSALNLLEDYKSECHLFYNYYEKNYPDKEIYKALYFAYLGRYYKIKYNLEKTEFYAENALKIYHRNKKDENLIPVYKIYQFYSSYIRDSYEKNSNRSNQLRYGDSLLFYFNKRYPYDNVKKAAILLSKTAVNLDNAANNLYMLKTNLEHGKEYAYLAIKDYNKAIAINESKTSYYNPQNAYLNSLKGLMYFYLKDYKNAVMSYDAGINILTSLSKNNNEFTLNNYHLLVLLRWKSWCLDTMNKETPDIKLLYEINNTLLLNEKVWTRYSRDLMGSKEQYYTDTFSMVPFPFLVKNNFELYKLTNKDLYLEKALEYDEKSKYSSLLNEINANKITKEDNKLLTNKKIKAYNSLCDILLFKSGIMIKESSDFSIDLNKYLIEESKSNSIKKNNIIALKEIQTNLKSNEAIISYSTIRFQDFAIQYIKLIEKNKIKLIQIRNIDNHWGHEIITNSINIALSKNDITSYKKEAFKLYSIFFKPIETELSKGITHIEIIPDAEISNISFETLLYENVQTNDFRKLPYLIHKYNFSYSLSSSISKFNNDRKRKKLDKTSVFSPSFEEKKLSKLELSKHKAEILATKYNAAFFKGEKASLNNFAAALEKSKTVAVFSHAQSNNNFEDEKKGIYFSDAFLNLNEIYDLKSNCDLLILGACETGYGAKEKGEGNINLSRAFTSIGVKSMLLAFWKIDEESTMTITESFLNYLQEGYTKSEALQKSKLNFLKTANPRNANPYYWAGLYVLGNNENLKPLEESSKLWLLSIFPIMGGFIYLKKSRKTKTILLK